MVYQVIRIDEDLDFGCEERPEDEPVMVIVHLRSETQNELILRKPDQMLIDKGINEGDMVYFDENREIHKKEK